MAHAQHTLRIDSETSRTGAIKLIKNALDTHPGVVYVDLSDVHFPLHRDFFLVLSRRFPRDRYILRLKQEKTVELARGLGIQAELIGIQAEFERAHAGSVNLATHNMTMLEYLWYEIKRGWLYLRFVLFERKRKEKKLPQYKQKNSNFILIVLGLIVSLTLLLFIFHFAVSKTIVTITPDITVRPVSANIVYRAESVTGSILSTQNALSLKEIILPVDVSMRFKIDAIDPNSAMNARGVITIYNELTVAQELRPQTRFVTTEGLVFRSLDWVKVPASQTLNGITEMGVTEIEVVADSIDGSGKIVGTRGNVLAGTDFTIPGLKFNRDKIYAKAKHDFTG